MSDENCAPRPPCELLKGVTSLALQKKCLNHKRSFGRFCTVQNPHGFAQAPNPFPLPHHIWRNFHGNRNWRSGVSNLRLQPWGLNRWSPDGASPQRESYSYLSEWPNPRKAHRRNDKANKKNCKNHWIPKYEWNKCHRQGRSNCQHLLIVLSTKILRQVWKTTIHYCQSIICICICTIKSQCVVVEVGTDFLRRSQAKLLEKNVASWNFADHLSLSLRIR